MKRAVVRLWHRLFRRPGDQRSTVQWFAPGGRPISEYEAEEQRILTDWYEDGSHDRYPQMTDTVREVCIGYLERMFALPDAEVRR